MMLFSVDVSVHSFYFLLLIPFLVLLFLRILFAEETASRALHQRKIYFLVLILSFASVASVSLLPFQSAGSDGQRQASFLSCLFCSLATCFCCCSAKLLSPASPSREAHGMPLVQKLSSLLSFTTDCLFAFGSRVCRRVIRSAGQFRGSDRCGL